MNHASKKYLRDKSALDVSPETLDEISAQATQLVVEYFRQVAQRGVVAKNHAGKTTSLLNPDLPQDGVPLDQLIAECRTIFNLSRHNGHPRFFGYVASPSTPIGAYADLITSALNGNVTCWRSAPAGTEIEKLVVRWLGTLIRYDANSRGLLTSGGSIANLTALLIAARKRLGAQTAQKGLWNSGPPLRFYASEEAHMSIAKAADILGFGREHVRTVGSDHGFRIDPRDLRERIRADFESGFRPCCVVASAGTVNTGAVDPLGGVAEVAREFGLWFHVDGAYGAVGILDPGKKDLFAGIELADSVSLDPHKWLYVPIDVGCLLYRDEAVAGAAFSTEDAEYLKIHGLRDEETFAFWDYGVELSRRFRALKVWLTLRYYGTSKIAEAISGDIALAEYLGRLIVDAKDFELLAPVGLSICCFRYVPPAWLKQDANENDVQKTEVALNELNQKILSSVQKDGRAYVSNATVGGRFGLRACITNFRTTKKDIEQTVEVVRDIARGLVI